MLLGNRHVIISGLLTLLGTFLAIAIVGYCINMYAPGISNPAIVLLFIGLALAAMLPSVLTSWILILLTALGAAILVLGDVPMPFSSKLILLAVAPASAGLMSIDRYVLIRFGWARFNRRDIERYSRHYDPVTKFQKLYNAEKMYEKVIRFIRNDLDGALWCNVAAIHWANSAQFRQFHENEYSQELHDIAQVLKDDRLPSESLYYLDDGTFLIISHLVPEETYEARNVMTRKHLNGSVLLGTTPQFKWGSLRIDHSNVNDFPTLKDATRRLQREMETDLVVEYLKG
ncbi:MAG: hypothetical protein LKF99_03735 [Bifidobacterium sp.]|nr:hypothetical protein [Bifidobacterium sp.]